MKYASLESLCSQISSGGTPSRKKSEYYCENGGHLWVKSKELLECAISDTEEKITDEGLVNSSAKYYPEGAVLLAMYGANVGQLAWLKKPATVNQAICAMVVNPEKVDFRYLFYALTLTRQGLVNKAHGAAQQNLNSGLVKSFEIPIHSLKIQEQIAQVLFSYDNLIENNNRRIAILEEMAQSLYSEWFVKFHFPGHENCQFKDSPLGEIPEGWEVKKFGELVHFLRKSVQKGPVEGSMPYMGLEHFPRKSLSLSEWELVDEIGSSKLKFQTGDILFGKIRPYFHKVGVAQTNGLCSSDTFVWRPIEEKLFGLVASVAFSDDFVAHSVQTSQGTKMPRANWDVLKEYDVVVPSEQLLDQFNEIASDAVNQIALLSSKNRNLKKQRDLLLPKLISGEIEL